jgi:hypothetical protein
MAKRNRRDWQERAFEESEFQRREQEASGSEMPVPLAHNVDLPRRSTWRWTLGGVAAIIVAILIRDGLDSRTPSLVTNCKTPAMALSATSLNRGSVIRWSATGPPNMHFLIAVGVARLVPGTNPGQLHPVPDAGGTAATTQLFGATATKLSGGCKANGSFTVDVPAGQYNVRLFRLVGSGASVSGTPVATRPLKVSS